MTSWINARAPQSRVFDNVWANNEGTIAVDSVTTGDLWLGEDHKGTHHHAHEREEIDRNVQRLAALNRGISDERRKSHTAAAGPPNSRPPSSVVPGGHWFSPAQGDVGGFRGLPKFVGGATGHVGVIGGSAGDGKAPAITQLIQGGWLPDKSRGDIEAEMRDFNRWQGAQTNFKGECRRC